MVFETTGVVRQRGPALHKGTRATRTAVLRVLGALLLALSLLPLYRLLAHPHTGLAGSSTVGLLEIYSDFMWTGLLLMLPVALLCGLFVSSAVLDRIARGLHAMARIRTVPHAALLGLLSFALTLAFTLAVLDGKPNQIDSLAQMFHARFWAEGRLAGPLTDGGGFWAMQNSLFTEHGWVSQYPPGHIALLALALWLGAPAALGATLVGITVFMAALLAQRLFPDDALIARGGPALLAVSPFFLLVGGSFMNHITVAACVTFGAYALLRAWQDRAAWAFPAGAAFAYALATRPLSTVAMGVALVFTIPLLAAQRATLARFVSIQWRALLGAAPVLGAFFAYNAHFFGSPLRMGYEVALGPAMKLGFHRDPWGNTYGLREAIGYTSSDLITLSVNLLETPIPSLAVIGLFLVVAPRVAPAVRLLLAWALAPVVTNMLYWHHGLFMGPRMLHESAPAWVLLFAVAAAGIVRAAPTQLLGRFNLRTATAGALAASLLFGLGYLAPARAASYGGGWLGITRVTVPHTNGPSIVFVHDAWGGRVAMTLAATGFRLDQVETLLRQNPTCIVHRLAMLSVSGEHGNASALHARLDTVPRADRLPRAVEIVPGDRIRIAEGERLTPECIREAESDRFGILDVAPLLWQGDLPGSDPAGAMFVRDLGPTRNARVIEQNPERTPWLFALPQPDGEPQLMPYDEGMRLLWKDAP